MPILGTDDDLFYIFPWNNGGGNQVATQVTFNGSSPNFFNGNYVPANWSLTEVVVPPPGPGPGGVPEPATSSLMLLSGFGLVGAVSRRPGGDRFSLNRPGNGARRHQRAPPQSSSQPPSRARSLPSAAFLIWQTRAAPTPSTWPISSRLSSSTK